MHRLPLLRSSTLRSALHDALPPPPASFRPAPLVDPQGRRYRYLRLSVTDRCDLACTYCMPPGGEDEHALRPELLTFEEAARLGRVAASLGFSRIRFTGGEPLVRKDFVELVRQVHRESGLSELVLTSNATRLGEVAAALKAAGLSGVNISIDSLSPARFRAITRGGDLARVLRGIDASLAAGLEVKTNTVALRGVNDDELPALVDWAWDRGITPRFIELMPIGEGANQMDRLLPAKAMVELLRDRLIGDGGDGWEPAGANRGPARYLRGRGGRVGFITAVTDEFCGSCNRVRVTARGDIRACLATRRAVSLRDVMRGGGSDRDVAWALSWAILGKHRGHAFTEALETEHANVGMSLIGG